MRNAFTALLDDAETAADNRELTPCRNLHARAAGLIGIQPPASGELARCTCQGYCEAVFDADHARTYLDGTVDFVQCPTAPTTSRAPEASNPQLPGPELSTPPHGAAVAPGAG
ncbi:hypothetical protein ACIBCO_35950 [Streptomyces violascens]|uniref:hypothetical protein n=1 Tax=Streptomyces violascens TaxID=67381 RepID=UPI0037A3EFCA